MLPNLRREVHPAANENQSFFSKFDSAKYASVVLLGLAAESHRGPA